MTKYEVILFFKCWYLFKWIQMGQINFVNICPTEHNK